MTLDSKVIGFVEFVTGLTVGLAGLLSLEVMSSAAIPALQHCFVADLGSCHLSLVVFPCHRHSQQPQNGIIFICTESILATLQFS